jgi:hypothetical protein
MLRRLLALFTGRNRALREAQRSAILGVPRIVATQADRDSEKQESLQLASDVALVTALFNRCDLLKPANLFYPVRPTVIPICSSLIPKDLLDLPVRLALNCI